MTTEMFYFTGNRKEIYHRRRKVNTVLRSAFGVSVVLMAFFRSNAKLYSFGEILSIITLVIAGIYYVVGLVKHQTVFQLLPLEREDSKKAKV